VLAARPSSAAALRAFGAALLLLQSASWRSGASALLRHGGALQHGPTASVSGLLRTAATELRGLSLSALAGDPGGRRWSAPASGCDAHGVYERSGSALAPRFVAAAAVSAAAGPLQLLPCPRGSLSGLLAQPYGAQGVGAGDTWVSVRAVGLNFRDVLNVLGMYPGDPGPPGGDFSGVVVQPGRGSWLRAGEAVFGLAAGCLGSHALTAARLSPLKPEALTFEQAASAPTIYVTVSLALLRAGRLESSSCVLIHAASGGVGLAAIEVRAPPP